jgi:hypothetical protein
MVPHQWIKQTNEKGVNIFPYLTVYLNLTTTGDMVPPPPTTNYHSHKQVHHQPEDDAQDDAPLIHQVVVHILTKQHNIVLVDTAAHSVKILT